MQRNIGGRTRNGEGLGHGRRGTLALSAYFVQHPSRLGRLDGAPAPEWHAWDREQGDGPAERTGHEQNPAPGVCRPGRRVGEPERGRGQHLAARRLNLRVCRRDRPHGAGEVCVDAVHARAAPALSSDYPPKGGPARSDGGWKRTAYRMASSAASVAPATPTSMRAMIASSGSLQIQCGIARVSMGSR